MGGRMKKFAALILILVFLCSFVACTDETSYIPTPDNPKIDNGDDTESPVYTYDSPTKYSSPDNPLVTFYFEGIVRSIPEGYENEYYIGEVIYQGSIVIELYPEIAPLTVANFLRISESGYYTDTIFHRVINEFVVQGGAYSMSEDNVPYYKEGDITTIKGEFAANDWTVNDLSHTRGVISMARQSSQVAPESAYNTASSQFFIVSASDGASYLDGSYAAFGCVRGQASFEAVDRLDNFGTDTILTVSGISLDDFPVSTLVITETQVDLNGYTYPA